MNLLEIVLYRKLRKFQYFTNMAYEYSYMTKATVAINLSDFGAKIDSQELILRCLYCAGIG